MTFMLQRKVLTIPFQILHRYKQLQFLTNVSCVRLPMDYIETLGSGSKNPQPYGRNARTRFPTMIICHYVMTFHSDGRKSVNSHCCYTDLNTSLVWNCRKINLHTYSTSILHLIQLLKNGNCLKRTDINLLQKFNFPK